MRISFLVIFFFVLILSYKLHLLKNVNDVSSQVYTAKIPSLFESLSRYIVKLSVEGRYSDLYYKKRLSLELSEDIFSNLLAACRAEKEDIEGSNITLECMKLKYVDKKNVLFSGPVSNELASVFYNRSEEFYVYDENVCMEGYSFLKFTYSKANNYCEMLSNVNFLDLDDWHLADRSEYMIFWESLEANVESDTCQKGSWYVNDLFWTSDEVAYNRTVAHVSGLDSFYRDFSELYLSEKGLNRETILPALCVSQNIN